MYIIAPMKEKVQNKRVKEDTLNCWVDTDTKVGIEKLSEHSGIERVSEYLRKLYSYAIKKNITF